MNPCNLSSEEHALNLPGCRCAPSKYEWNEYKAIVPTKCPDCGCSGPHYCVGKSGGNQTSYAKAIEKKEQSAIRKKKRQEKGAMLGLRAKKPKKKKSHSLSKLKKLLWEEQRQVVYSESPNECMSCGGNEPPMACHIVPSNDGAITRFFLPNIYRGCRDCNMAEQARRGRWRGKFEELFGRDYVEALYLMSEEDNAKPMNEKFQLKKYWVLEQTCRMRKIRLDKPVNNQLNCL